MQGALPSRRKGLQKTGVFLRAHHNGGKNQETQFYSLPEFRGSKQTQVMLFRENKNTPQSRLPNSYFFSDKLQRVQSIQVCESRESKISRNVLSLNPEFFSLKPLSSPLGSWKVNFLTQFAQS